MHTGCAWGHLDCDVSRAKVYEAAYVLYLHAAYHPSSTTQVLSGSTMTNPAASSRLVAFGRSGVGISNVSSSLV